MPVGVTMVLIKLRLMYTATTGEAITITTVGAAAGTVGMATTGMEIIGAGTAVGIVGMATIGAGTAVGMAGTETIGAGIIITAGAETHGLVAATTVTDMEMVMPMALVVETPAAIMETKMEVAIIQVEAQTGIEIVR